MLVGITLPDNAEVISVSEAGIIAHIPHLNRQDVACHIVSVPGKTEDDYLENTPKSSGYVWLNSNNGRFTFQELTVNGKRKD